MLYLAPLEWNAGQWDAAVAKLPDVTPFQTSAWMRFLCETQHGEPVLAGIYGDTTLVGYFTGMVIQKFGVRILGSPFPGWSTGYMGFNMLDEQVPRRDVVQALRKFAFDDLGCMHLEFMDRKLSVAEMQRLGFDHFILPGFEIDLTQPGPRLFSAMTHQCRTNVRKAEKSGLVIQECHDAKFADDYYDQIENIFARQGLVPTFPRERVQKVLSCLAATNLGLFLRAVNADGKCVATTISVGTENLAYLWGAASLPEFQPLRPNELTYWSNMRLWKQRGARVLDMGGGGEYKRKYGGQPIAVPWFRKSRNGILPILRTTAEHIYRMRQRLTVARFRHREEAEKAASTAA
jgi:hypothetical protein